MLQQHPGPGEIPTTTPPELTPMEEPMPEMPDDDEPKEEPEIPADPTPEREIPNPPKES